MITETKINFHHPIAREFNNMTWRARAVRVNTIEQRDAALAAGKAAAYTLPVRSVVHLYLTSGELITLSRESGKYEITRSRWN